MTEPVISPLYTENSDFSAYVDALNLNLNDQNSQHSSLNRFWSTEERMASDQSTEVLEVTFSMGQYINYVTFDLAIFPQTAVVEYLDDGDVWQPLKDNMSGTDLEYSIGSSNPGVLAASFPAKNLHPQHGYEGHWRNFSSEFRVVYATKLRIALRRKDISTVPKSRLGVPLAYSLAVRNLDVGYLVKNREDVPLTAKSTVNSPAGAFTFNTDLLNSTVGYVYRENQANDVNRDGLIWRSEPQPYANAVVNFYADLRDENGEGQWVDRINLVPISSNCHLSLYYSDDEYPYSFKSKTDPLANDIIKVNGANPGDVNLLIGDNFTVDVDTNLLGFIPQNPWWVGLTVWPQQDSSNLPDGKLVIFSLNGIEVNLTQGYINVSNGNGDSFSLALDWYGAQPLSIVLAYDGKKYSLNGLSVSTVASISIDATVELSSRPSGPLRLGKLIADSTTGRYKLTNMVFKEEPLVDGAVSHLDSYSHVPVFSRDENESVGENALFRYDPESTGRGFLNFYGGAPDRYEWMIWSPINRDYLLRQGDIKLPLTKAKFWKFEITNLQPQYFDIYQPVTREILTFPSSVIKQYIGRQVERSNSQEVGIAQSKIYNGDSFYYDTPLYVGTGQPRNGYSSTAVYVADDSGTAQRLAEQFGNSWNYRNWHTSNAAPSWPSVGRHTYNKEYIEHNETVAYFAALSSVTFRRRNYLSAYSYEYYDQALVDTNTYDAGNWIPENDGLFSGDTHYAQATSKVYPTLDSVKAIQFAAQQTEAVQILPNDDFTSLDNSDWVDFGDGYIVGGSNNTKTITVSRNVQIGYWGSINVKYPTSWPQDILFENLVTSGQPGLPEGGIQTAAPIPVPTGGSLYAAARIFATKPLAHPLWVQIVDADKDTLIAEQQATISQGKVGEWFVRWDISMDTKPSSNLFKNLGALWSDSEGKTWKMLENFLPGKTKNIFVRLVQKNASIDSWDVDRLSLYYSPILWEFSRNGGTTWWHASDIRNNPYGVLQFPEAPEGTPDVRNQLRWRVTTFGSNTHVSDLVIHPWYTGKVGVGSFSRGAQLPDGPNIVNYDDDPGVLNDPRFKVWNNPIPRDWWFAFQSTYSTSDTTVVVSDDDINLQTASAIVIGR